MTKSISQESLSALERSCSDLPSYAIQDPRTRALKWIEELDENTKLISEQRAEIERLKSELEKAQSLIQETKKTTGQISNKQTASVLARYANLKSREDFLMEREIVFENGLNLKSKFITVDEIMYLPWFRRVFRSVSRQDHGGSHENEAMAKQIKQMLYDRAENTVLLNLIDHGIVETKSDAEKLYRAWKASQKNGVDFCEVLKQNNIEDLFLPTERVLSSMVQLRVYNYKERKSDKTRVGAEPKYTVKVWYYVFTHLNEVKTIVSMTHKLSRNEFLEDLNIGEQNFFGLGAFQDDPRPDVDLKVDLHKTRL